MAETVSLSLEEAQTYLKDHARHYTSPAEPIAAIGLSEDGKLRGAALLGRTPEGDAELAHIYCDGAWQGYSLLYGACWRAFKALGYKHLRL